MRPSGRAARNIFGHERKSQQLQDRGLRHRAAVIAIVGVMVLGGGALFREEFWRRPITVIRSRGWTSGPGQVPGGADRQDPGREPGAPGLPHHQRLIVIRLALYPDSFW
jgi:hypothetical protein